jgi:hypothetical protein
MKIGKVYRIVDTTKECECGKKKVTKRSFPFNQKIGLFLGYTPSGMLRFIHTDRKESLMAGGAYQEVVKPNIVIGDKDTK